MIPPSTASKGNLPIIKKASGKYCWTTDGKKLLDFSGSNLTVILGHRKYKLGFSPNFPGVSVLEGELSKLLERYTLNEHFRFFKNGNDAVACAIRLARHILKKPNAKIAYLGYAGSHNEYVYTFNKNGIPKSNSFQYPGVDNPKCDILVYESRLTYIAKDVKAKLKICDHLKSGLLGLIELPTPDTLLHCYGKSLSNGYPLAVLGGPLDKIGEIYYSTTYGGENVGLEAAIKTIKEFKKKEDGYLELLRYARSVLPEWRSLNKKEINIFLKHGIINTGFWQIMVPHIKKDIDKLAEVYKKL